MVFENKLRIKTSYDCAETEGEEVPTNSAIETNPYAILHNEDSSALALNTFPTPASIEWGGKFYECVSFWDSETKVRTEEGFPLFGGDLFDYSQLNF